MGLLSFLDSLITGGNATGWTPFGGSNASKGVPAAGTEKGQDIGLSLGTPIPAEPGTVTAIEPWGYGDYAVSEQLPSGGILTVGHITPDVSVGQKLTSASIIGTSRGVASPISTGPHIEVRYQTGQDKPFVNPLTIIQGGASDAEMQGQVGATGQAPGQAQSSVSDIPIIGGIAGFATNLFGDIVRVILAILAIISLFIGLYILFKPADAPGLGDAAKMAMKLAPLAVA
jgi:hypothetical protein